MARKLFVELAEQRARQEERFRLHQEGPLPVLTGIPRPAAADPTMSAFEVMRSADADAEQLDPTRIISPSEEFLTQRLGPPQKVVTEEQ